MKRLFWGVALILSTVYAISLLKREPLVSLVDSGSQDFYVWQRAWNHDVKSSVHQEDGMLYPLTAEFSSTGVVSVAVDWKSFLSVSKLTAVIRVHTNWLGRTDLVDRLLKEIKRYPEGVSHLQLDLDCPESKLLSYARVLKQVRQRLPQKIHLSITVLPTHLACPDFKELLPYVDYYVLQLHGIEAPRHIDVPMALINFDVAERAFKRACLINSPFKIALPTYAYALYFDKASGNFIRLSAENQVLVKDNYQKVIIHADLLKLAQFIKKERRGCLNYRGILWFRLPNKRDTLTVSRSLIRQLAHGQKLSLEPELILQQKGSRVDLFVENFSIFEMKSIKIGLHCKVESCDWDLVHGFHSSQFTLPGQLPREIIGRLPPPGKRIFVGWFRPHDNNKIRVSIKCLEN
jgi:hypothetical protein